MELKELRYEVAYDVAAAVHFPAWQTTLGLEFNKNEWDRKQWRDTQGPYAFQVQNGRFGIHLADGCTTGWHSGLPSGVMDPRLQYCPLRANRGDATAVGWDLSFSIHGRHGGAFIGRPTDEIRYGLTVDNFLGTEINFNDENQREPLHQVFRAGAGYFWRTGLGQLLHADILSALVTVESSLPGTEHEFRNWGTVAGAAELRILEVFMVSAGTENVIRLESMYGDQPEYPVLRYGVGLDLPLDRIFRMDIPFTCSSTMRMQDGTAETRRKNSDISPSIRDGSIPTAFSLGQDYSDGVIVRER